MKWHFLALGTWALLASQQALAGPAKSALLMAEASAAVASAKRVPGAPALVLGSFDLAAQGYVAEEFFLTGNAASYKLESEARRDGKWNVRADQLRPYTTRIVVVRPIDSQRFSGTAVVEWLNVSAGGDSPPGWGTMHREIIRSGHAYVGVSVQKVGIDGGASLGLGAPPLKVANPSRYGELAHPGDDFALDIFAQAGRALRANARDWLGAPLRQAIAYGASQSAFFLSTFVNIFGPRHPGYDGYLVQARFGGVAPLADPDIFAPAVHSEVAFRDDVATPVLVVESETDVMDVGLSQGGYASARQPTNPWLSVWEIAGASHFDISVLAVSDMDTDNLPEASRNSAWRPRSNALGQTLAVPLNSAPQQYYILNAALRRIVAWADQGKAPSSPQPLKLDAHSTGPQRLLRDAQGIAVGGVRSPWVDAPLMAHSGLPNSGGPVGLLIGQSRPFDRNLIERLYPGGLSDYKARFGASLDRAMAQGFILAENKAEILSLAEASWTWATSDNTSENNKP